MIRQDNLRRLTPIADEAVEEVFQIARKNEANPNDFILFLANAYKLDCIDKGYSPYVLGPGMDRIFDKDRTEFLNDFMLLEFHYEQQYSLTDDEKIKEKMRMITTHLEMMIYAHAWESVPNLKDLKHIADLIESKPYNWDIKVPSHKEDKSKWEFITREIRNIFQQGNLKIAQIISESYHSQLRNAFAHSQYAFFKDVIRLGNYEGENWQIQNISYEDWEDRFLKTALLFNTLLKKKQDYKKSIGKEKEEITIYIPNRKLGYINRVRH